MHMLREAMGFAGGLQYPPLRCTLSSSLGDLEYAQERKAPIQHADGVRDQQALVVHVQDGDEDCACRVGTPHDGDDGQDVADDMVDADANPDATQADHGQEAVAQHRGGAVRVDPVLRHEVEQRVDGHCAQQAHAVDV